MAAGKPILATSPTQPSCVAESGHRDAGKPREREVTRLVTLLVWGLEPEGGAASQSPEKMGEPSASSSGAKPAGWGDSMRRTLRSHQGQRPQTGSPEAESNS